MISNIIGKIFTNCPILLMRARLLPMRPVNFFAVSKRPYDPNAPRKKKVKGNDQNYPRRARQPQNTAQQGERTAPFIPKLWHFLQEHKQVIDGVAEVSEAIVLCKKIATHYDKRRKNQFKTCREQLEKLLNSLTGLPFPDLSLDHHIAVLGLLLALQNSQILKRPLIITLKDLVFMNLQSTFQALPTLPLADLCRLFAILLPFNHPHLPILAEQLLTSLSEQKERFDPLLAEVVIEGLSSRVFLSGADIKVLKAMLYQLDRTSSQLPLLSLARIFHALESMGYQSIFGDIVSLNQLYHLKDIFLPKLKAVSFDDPTIVYLTSVDFRSLREESVFQQILEKVMLRIKEKDSNPKVLPILVGCLQRATLKLTDSQIDEILSYLEASYKDEALRKSMFYDNSLEVVVLQLVQSGAFDGRLVKLHELINADYFQANWSIIYTFGLKGHPFPLMKIESKIKPKTTQFNLDSNYLKAAVAISLQQGLYPNSSVLSTARNGIVASLQESSWGEKEIQWLRRQSNIHPHLLKDFHDIYHTVINSKLQLFAIARSPRYYQYFIICDSNLFHKDVARTMTPNIIESLMEREQWNMTHINPLLLSIIHLKLQVGVLDIKQGTGLGIVRLLLHYTYVVHRMPKQSIQAYHKLIMQVLHFYSQLRGQALEFNHILKRMLVPPKTSPYYDSPEHVALLTGCLSLIEHIDNPDLVAIIIRLAISKKGLKAVPRNCKLALKYFTEEELEQLSIKKK